MLVMLLVELDVMLLGGNERRACKHHQQKCGCNHLSHGKDLTPKMAREVCFASNPPLAPPRTAELFKA
jgi:hypothetical protein